MGTIRSYNSNTGFGIIDSTDGKSYKFLKSKQSANTQALLRNNMQGAPVLFDKVKFFDRKSQAFQDSAENIIIQTEVTRTNWIAETSSPAGGSKNDSQAIKTETGIKRRVEYRPLPKPLDSVASGEVEYKYGLINIFSSQYALINPQYNNRAYSPNSVYDIGSTTYFNPKEATVLPDSRLKTGKSTYLVRYVPNGVAANPTTGIRQPIIDYSYPVEVLSAFSKKQCASIIILEDDRLKIEYIENGTPQSAPSVSKNNDDVLGLMLGESVYFELKDGGAVHGLFVSENDDSYQMLGDRSIQKKSVSKLFRFGVVTALNLERGTITINNIFDVSMSVAESKMLSILKNQKN